MVRLCLRVCLAIVESILHNYVVRLAFPTVSSVSISEQFLHMYQLEHICHFQLFNYLQPSSELTESCQTCLHHVEGQMAVQSSDRVVFRS